MNPDYEIQFTRHARARMDLREVTEAEVERIVKRGKREFLEEDGRTGTPLYSYRGSVRRDFPDRKSEVEDVKVIGKELNETVVVITVEIE